MSREDPPLRIRLPAALKSAVQARAAENRRSMNAEIVRRLEWSLEAEQDHQPGQDSVRRLLQAGLPAEITNSDRIAKLERRLAELERKSK
ncbi:Arc family DNA-binding protein [Aliihoeflea sp. 40Bstr573]|uniref:Arc family DNA-binding protein n=1 Tax=Aliihoeflea sp. 40Bstr573 TaxID=2696467 RepID=UPI0021127E4C|nr:Arc family DNA-binding protein [Aliihoeflea sp. 40Bstr573]MCO6387800.1 Arc family DNA-binding protein [Aliihoeflea sp. 40Bstr573]